MKKIVISGIVAVVLGGFAMYNVNLNPQNNLIKYLYSTRSSLVYKDDRVECRV
jgi:uncharacterized protein YxeA